MATNTHASASIRRLTSEPGYHWFGYYDKREFDTSSRYVLGMRVGFEGRHAEADDVIEVGMVDTGDGDRWIRLGESRSWSWQQGCMLQWLPGSDSRVIWNDRDGDRFISRILDVKTGATRVLPMPVYSIFPDGRTAVTTDFRRLRHARPECGYAGVADPNAAAQAPDDVGVWRIDLETGKCELLVSIAQAAAVPYPYGHVHDGVHFFEHLIVNTDGTLIAFLHRWRPRGADGFYTRMFVVGRDGRGLRPVVENRIGHVSHFLWRDQRHIMAFARTGDGDPAYYTIDALTGAAEQLPLGTADGHFCFVPGKKDWILNDSYPHGEGQRVQTLFLQHLTTGRRVEIGSFPYSDSPRYAGQLRCDLHPRISSDGRFAAFDSAHDGGRQIYLVDLPK